MDTTKRRIVPEELDDLIQEYLSDGIITAMERQVLLNKAKSLGLNLDEIDLYIDAQQQKADQAVAAAMNNRRGKTCPFCGSSIPELTDKCPNCGGNITPEASEELAEIIEYLEDALVNFKSGEDVDKSKAEVERYMRKARLYYGNNPKIQRLLEEVEYESKAVMTKAKKKLLLNFISKNSKIILSLFVFILISGTIYYFATLPPKHERERIEKDEKAFSAVKKTADEVNDFLEKGEVDKAANALTMCEVSDLGDVWSQKQATALYKSLLANVIDAYLDKGQKKKAQNLVISCSSKFDYGKSGISDFFLKLGSNGDYEFKEIEE